MMTKLNNDLPVSMDIMVNLAKCFIVTSVT